MADTEFEEFRAEFEKLPQFIDSRKPFYSLVPDVDLEDDESPSSTATTPQNDADDDVDERSDGTEKNAVIDCQSSPTKTQQVLSTISNISSSSSAEDDDLGDGLRSGNGVGMDDCQQLVRTMSLPPVNPTGRRRRKLPEIPKNKKSSVFKLLNHTQSLADEIPTSQSPAPFTTSFKPNSLLALKCSYLLDEDSSPDSDRLYSLGDVDSGHSTAHSPNDFKSLSPPNVQATPHSPFPPALGGVPYSQIEMLEATHRGLHKFVPRHHDEIEVEIGDPIYVQTEADDLWCEGVNLRTGRQGIFPSAYAVDLEYNDFDSTTTQVKRERYLLGYLGSVETLSHKGTSVVCSAVRKIVGPNGESPKAQPCILEISDQGLRMVDRSKKKDKGPCIDYFYSLKNVSFCAFHPRDHRYIGFITKHPTVQRFACHVFQGHESTRPVAEAVGRAFQRFYQKFIDTAYPVEDIYLE